MKRGLTGCCETPASGARRWAFVPHPLPPEPALVLSGACQFLLEQVLVALGRLKSIATCLPDPHLFLYAYVRKEAVLSSQIEETRSSLSDSPGVRIGSRCSQNRVGGTQPGNAHLVPPLPHAVDGCRKKAVAPFCV